VTELANLKLAVLLGGSAAERSVSLQSGAAVAEALRGAGATVDEIDPSVDGWISALEGIDFVFNLLHGPGGEDGCVQGLLEMMRIPYSGSGVAGAALTMDKVMTKRIWRDSGLPTPGFELLNEYSPWNALIEEYGVLFVKPAREGSSLGMARAETPEALQAAWRKAAKFGRYVLGEQFVAGPEYTVAILDGKALPSIRIEPTQDFYDFDAKYVSDETRFHCPSGLSEADEAELAELAESAFAASGAEVWGRIDVIRSMKHGWQLLEVNTIPGMTSHSLVPMAAKAAGMDWTTLLERIWQASMEARQSGWK
jgi:D-alanine-D-alanine ligase